MSDNDTQAIFHIRKARQLLTDGDPRGKWADHMLQAVGLVGFDRMVELAAMEVCDVHSSDDTGPRFRFYESIVITADSTDMPPVDILMECGNASYGLGGRWEIDWDHFYDTLDMLGWDMQGIGGTIDNRIRRLVRKAVRDGEIQ